MRHSIRLLFAYILLFTFSSCSLVGIHLQVKNPKHPGSYPHFSKTIKLLGDQNTKYRNSYDVTFYNLNITVDQKNKYLKGVVEMRAIALTNLDTIQIDLFENMIVKSISYATLMSHTETGTGLITANFTRNHGAIFIPIKQKENEIFKIRIEYEGKPVIAPKPPWKGGFVWKKDKEGNPWIGVTCETEGASLWWPCKDVTNDEPDSAAINITVSGDLTAVSNGKFLGKETNGDKTTFKWYVSNPINLYNVTIYVGKFALIEDSLKSAESGKVLSINHYVLPANLEKAKKHLAQAKEQIAFYEKIFGEYPWYSDGYKLVESPYEGMEHQSAIAYGNGYKNSYNGFDYIILHESAHEWWGNSISASDLSDVWLHEGFATYAEALFVEKTQGENAYLRYLLMYRMFIKNKRPVVGPVGARFFDYKDSDVYMKGAWILHTLRTVIADDKIFFDILKSFRVENNGKTVSSLDFIKMVNEKSGRNLNWFFSQYLNKREVPFLEFYWDGTDFYYKWKQVDSTFIMQSEIILDGLVRILLKPTANVQKLSVSNKTYSEIAFNNYTQLFGTKENKRLVKEFGTNQK